MTLFVLLAAILVLGAVGLATYPLLKTQKKLAATLVIGLPLLTTALYQYVGNFQALNAPAIAASQANSESAAAPDIDTAIVNLQEELKANPANLQGWILLARTHMAMGNFEAAEQALSKAITLEPGNPDLKTERAESLMRASNTRQFSNEAIALLRQALEQNPEHERALFFMGMHHLQQNDLTKAETYFNKLLPKLEPDAENALREQINIVRAQQNKPLLPMMSDQSSENTTSLKVTITLDNALASNIQPGAILFVFAKTTSGAGPPVAAKRVEISTYPIQVELSDADSLMPTAVLSSQEQVSVSARISMQGIANAQAGDIEAEPVIANTKNLNPIEIKLTRVIQ